MSATATTLLASGIAAKKAIENIVTDLYELAKSEGGFQLKKWTASHQIDTVYKKARTIRLVKTILQPEKAVDLSIFYYPSKIPIDGKRVTINRLSDFEYDGNILIEGTVGQGKSIFLRYLASFELFNSRRVPAFIELRRLRQGQSLLSLILEELKVLGFDMDEKLFTVFASKGRIILCLDAFDEVKEELRQELLSEIELLSRNFEELRIVVTSRPNHGISTSPLFRVFRLRGLLQITGTIPSDYDLQRQKIIDCCGKDQLAFRGPKARTKRFTWYSTGQHWPTSHLMHDDTTYAYMFFEIDRNDLRSVPVKKEGDAEVITVSELLEIPACKNKAEEACKKLFAALFKTLREAEEYVSHVEQTKAVFEF